MDDKKSEHLLAEAAAQVERLVAEAAYTRAQAAALRAPLHHNPALWTVIGSVIVAFVGFMGTFQTEAHKDRVALLEKMAELAKEDNAIARAELKEGRAEVAQQRAQLARSHNELAALDRRRAGVEAELKAEQDKLQGVQRAIQANPKRFHDIGAEILRSEATMIKMRERFGRELSDDERQSVLYIVGYVHGRAVATRQRELESTVLADRAAP